MGSPEAREACKTVAGDEDADFFVSERFQVELDMSEEIPSIANISAVGDTRKGMPCAPATCVAGFIREAEVVLSRILFVQTQPEW